jgi:hypothetical protein
MTNVTPDSDAQQTRYADVLARLRQGLATAEPGLRARTDDDFTLALADAWAVLAEILGFHSARHDEEARLDLATELRSLIELSGLVGYRPDPGLAASASLAFTIDDSGASPVITVPLGTTVTSVPNPGEQPVTFETVQPIQARPDWNALRPRLSQPQTFGSPSITVTGTPLVGLPIFGPLIFRPLIFGLRPVAPRPLDPRLVALRLVDARPTSVLLAGTTTGVVPGDGMLVPIGASGRAFGVVTAVSVRPDDPPIPGTGARAGWTRVELATLADDELTDPADAPTTVSLRPADVPAGPLLGALSPDGATTLDSDQLHAAATNGGFSTEDVFRALRATRAQPLSVMVFRSHAGILGAGAPAFDTLPPAVQDQFDGLPEYQRPTMVIREPVRGLPVARTLPVRRKVPNPYWTTDGLNVYPVPPPTQKTSGETLVFCDTVLRTAGSGPIVLRDGTSWRVVTAGAVDTRSVSAFTVSGKSTVFTVAAHNLHAFTIRGTTVYAGGESLPLAAEPVTDALPDGTAIELDDWVDGLTPGQTVAVTGRSVTHPGLDVAHVSAIKHVRHALSRTGSTSIDLVDPLPDALVRESVRINGNVAPATHGESRSEVLGSGQGQDPTPSFTLSGRPLTYLPDVSGSVPALTVTVAGVRRDRVPALLDPAERGYVVRQDDRGTTTIQFGSPLPTGVINVRADYRVGLGAAAAVQAGQLSLLAARPPGVRAVTNPLPARGGADPETVAEARRNAPISVRTLGRAVSLPDYADFARAYPGVAKAAARWRVLGSQRGVQVSVIGPHGVEITTDSPVYTGLLRAYAAAGDELVPVRVVPALQVPVRVGAHLRIDPARDEADVRAAASTALAAALSFETRDLGQPVLASELVEVLQTVTGVVAANVPVLCRLVQGQPEGGITYRPVLRADPPAGATATAAVLLTFDPTALELAVVAP